MAQRIVHAVDVEASPKEVADAIATQEGLAAFWVPNVEATAKKGTVSRFRFDGAPVELKMRVDELSTKRVAWTCLGDFPGWEGSIVVWELTKLPKDAGTKVLFRHEIQEDWPDTGLGEVSYTWAGICARLKQYLETGKPNPFLK